MRELNLQSDRHRLTAILRGFLGWIPFPGVYHGGERLKLVSPSKDRSLSASVWRSLSSIRDARFRGAT